MAVYQLDGRKEWMRVAPVLGEVLAGSEASIELTLDSRTLVDNIYLGELEFTHNSAGGTNAYPIELWVGVSGTGGDEQQAAPGTLDLASSYPNPFNNSTTITFTLPSAGRGSLIIYDLQGRIVGEAVSLSGFKAGEHSVNWGATVSGVYFAVLEFENSAGMTERRVQKLICLP